MTWIRWTFTWENTTREDIVKWEYFGPPSHGKKIVTTLLEGRRHQWREMRGELNAVEMLPPIELITKRIAQLQFQIQKDTEKLQDLEKDFQELLKNG